MPSVNNMQSRLTVMLLLTIMFFIIEIIVGYITNSMALIADSFHMFSDAIALVIAFVSVRISPKKWSKNTFGWARAEVLGALVNAVFLCALCFSILIESIKRFIKPDLIHKPQLIIVVGALGLVINLFGLLLFKDGGGHFHHGHGHSHGHGHHHTHKHEHDLKHGHKPQNGHGDEEKHTLERDHDHEHQHEHDQLHHKDPQLSTNHETSQMNIRGVFLHVMADALGSVIVILSAIVVEFTENSIRYYIDPTLSVLMVCLILKCTWPLLTQSAMILLQTVPTHIEVDSLRRRLTQEIQGVLAVHEFHVWQLAGDRIIASAHIRCHNLQDYMRIAERVKEFFHNEGIHSTTIQPEFTDFENDLFDGGNNCALDCPSTQRPHCAPQTCCGTNRPAQNELDDITVIGSDGQPDTALHRRVKTRPSNSENATETQTPLSSDIPQDTCLDVMSSAPIV